MRLTCEAHFFDYREILFLKLSLRWNMTLNRFKALTADHMFNPAMHLRKLSPLDTPSSSQASQAQKFMAFINHPPISRPESVRKMKPASDTII